jgi:hypothetical protein
MMKAKEETPMTDPSNSGQEGSTSWRLKLGFVIFALSILGPVIGVPLVGSLGLSTAAKASISGGLLVSAEVLGIAAVAVMGKSGYAYLKHRLLAFLKRHGPPEVVSRRRYTIGLVMFCLPILFGWVSVYAAEWIPGFVDHPLPFAVVGDLMLLISLFVLGGSFWDKVRALFVHDAKVQWASTREGGTELESETHERK